MAKHWWMYLTAVLLTLAVGGGDPAQEEDRTGSAQLVGSMAQALSSADVTSVRVTVTAADMPTPGACLHTRHR